MGIRKEGNNPTHIVDQNFLDKALDKYQVGGHERPAIAWAGSMVSEYLNRVKEPGFYPPINLGESGYRLVCEYLSIKREQEIKTSVE